MNRGSTKSLFDFKDYKTYLAYVLGLKNIKGVRQKLAKEIDCHISLISQVLNGDQDFSLEQALGTSIFFQHTTLEQRYFILLVQIQKAGTQELRFFFAKKIDMLLVKTCRAQNQTRIAHYMPTIEEYQFFSSWYYQAIYKLISSEKYKTIDDISARLTLAPDLVKEALGYLVKKQHVIESNNKYSSKLDKVFQPIHKNSAIYQNFSRSWRTKVLNSIDYKDNKKIDYHYTVIENYSLENSKIIKDYYYEALREIKYMIKNTTYSNDEVYCINLDFFEILDLKV
jgi:hypothetical protein